MSKNCNILIAAIYCWKDLENFKYLKIPLQDVIWYSEIKSTKYMVITEGIALILTFGLNWDVFALNYVWWQFKKIFSY